MCPPEDKRRGPRSDPELPGTVIRPAFPAGDQTELIEQPESDLLRFLEKRGLLTRDQADTIRREIRFGSESLVARLVERGIPPQAAATALGDYFGLPRATELSLQARDDLLAAAPASLWRRALAIPVSEEDRVISIVTADPSLTLLHTELQQRLACDVEFSFATYPAVRAALARALGPKLIWRSAEGEPPELLLLGSSILLGKSPDNDLVLDEPTVSRRHARLERREIGWTILDLESANGTTVEGARIDGPTPLTSGSPIQLGRVELIFFEASDEEPPDGADALPPTDPESEPETSEDTEPEVAAEQLPGPQSPKRKKKGKKKGKKADSRMRAAWLRVGGQLLATVAMVLSPFIVIRLLDRGPESGRGDRADILFRESLPGSYEPSGVVQLEPGGPIWFVDDSRPGSLFRFRLDARGLVRGGAVQEMPIAVETPPVDLEALTVDPAGGIVYALSSQSLDGSLLRLEARPGSLVVTGRISDLRERLLSRYPALEAVRDLAPEEGGLNLEGIAWDPDRSRLLLAARSPIERTFRGEEAMIFPLAIGDVTAPLSWPNLELAEDPIFLDLEGSGIRGMEYDATRGEFLVLSGGSHSAGQFRLWSWSGEITEEPHSFPSVRFRKGQKPEGLARIRLDQGESLVVLVDDSGGYLLLTDDQLDRSF